MPKTEPIPETPLVICEASRDLWTALNANVEHPFEDFKKKLKADVELEVLSSKYQTIAEAKASAAGIFKARISQVKKDFHAIAARI